MSARRRIETLQTGRLAALLSELRRGNAFYRERLGKSGLGNESLTLADFSARMPFTSKMDLVWDREEFSPYGSNLTYPLTRYSRYCQSSEAGAGDAGTQGGELGGDARLLGSCLRSCRGVLFGENLLRVFVRAFSGVLDRL